MSTKTISKRVALATVVALGAGVLSLVSVSSASAALSTTAGINSTVNTANNTDATVGNMYVATLANTTGAATYAAGTAQIALTSLGLLSVSDIAGNSAPVAGTTQTATIVSNGSITLHTALSSLTSGASNIVAFQVTGGTIAGAGATDAGSSAKVYAFNPGKTAVGISDTGATTPFGYVNVVPNDGVSSFTVNMYAGTATTFTDAPTASGTPTLGTLKGSIVVSVATTATSGVLSLTKSGVYYATSSGGATSDITVPNWQNGSSGAVDPAVGTSPWYVSQYGSVVLKDAYGSILTSGILTATATNGAYVALTNTGTPSSSATSTSLPYATISSGVASLTVTPSVTTASTTTVTLSYNGTVVGTKAFSFQGQVAKVVLSSPMNGLLNNTGTASQSAPVNGVTVTFKDSAGNILYIGGSQTGYPTSLTKDAATAGAGISLNSTVAYPTPSVSQSAAAAYSTGDVAFGCGSQNSTGNLEVDYSNNDGSVITSNSVPVSCSGGASTYTANFDKATYAPGDVATLTVTFKDSSGALAADVAAGTAGGIASSTTGKTPNITGSNLTNTSGTSTTAGTNADVTTNGVATYKFIVGSTDGSYQAIVDFPFVDAAGVQAGITAGYKVDDGSTSLNDVLKGIVSLIASINKQIAALAKLVTKKK